MPIRPVSSVVNFSLKWLISQNFFFFFGMELPEEGTNVLSEWSFLKVGKVKFG